MPVSEPENIREKFPLDTGQRQWLEARGWVTGKVLVAVCDSRGFVHKTIWRSPYQMKGQTAVYVQDKGSDWILCHSSSETRFFIINRRLPSEPTIFDDLVLRPWA